MKLNHTTIYALAVLLLLLLLPFGCGGDDKGDPPEDAFDSQNQDGEVVQKPFVSVNGFDEGEVTTAQSTITLEGTMFYSDTVLVGDEEATLGEEIDDGVFLWSLDVELSEGTNNLQIKAATDDGLESEPVDVVVVVDPDYVPDPPENSNWVKCNGTDLLIWVQKDGYYDPAGSRPDEMHIDIVSDYRENSNHAFSSSAHSVTIVSSKIYHDIRQAESTATYRLEVHAWEQDDGFFTGGDDDLGTGSGEITIHFEDGWRTTEVLEIGLGGSTFKAALSLVCEAW